MLHTSPRAFARLERLAANHSASPQGKTAAPIYAALIRELFTNRECHGILVRFGKTAVYDRRQPLGRSVLDALPVIGNRCECLRNEIRQRIRIEWRNQQD